ncbi:hypothetical protein Lal_00039648 [Lupinus albus]|nr:hypothetical protein Lal_00039648 [Lupinus albus]
MASSSKRPRTSKSKQGESSSKSNLLNLTRLLANDAQRKVFVENFHGRAIFTPKYANNIYPGLVRVFYCNMNFRKNLMTSHVKGKDIVLDIQTFSTICCDIPTTGDINGFDLVCDWDDYDRNRFYLSICRIPKEEIERRKQQSLVETVKNMDILFAGYLTLEDRLVHYFLTYVILPKFSNHSQISDIELQLMYAIKYNIKLNWTKMIMQQMCHVPGSQSPLPYAIFITKILEHFGVSLDGETKVALNLRETKVDIEAVHKMGFVLDLVTRRTCYITTRMDAFDTQSQQIHFELHRLSSRLSNMDVDKDSSDPES